MATQLEVVRMIAPEFASVDDATVQNFLDLAPLYIDPEKVPVDRRGLALALKACSLMLDRSQSVNGESHGGNLISEREGDLSRSYGYSASKTGGKAKNNYEMQLDELYSSILGGSIMTRYGTQIHY